MIFSAILSFLGGASARALIGFCIDWLKQKQTHQQEMERMRLQGEFDQASHTRQLELINQQATLKLGEIKLVGENAIGLAEAQAFVEAQKRTNMPTGVRWIDGWNGTIRPLAATVSISLWLLKVIKAGLALTAWDEQLIASVLGYYFADRHMGKRK